MTAIAGIWSLDGEVDVSSACRDMLGALSVYGMDDRAQYASPALAMGRCLLRILPEDSFDHQPLVAPGVTSLVADVRLDNRGPLAAELGLSSEQAAAMADSDVLLAAWLHWREQCVDHLSGAFSFAVWNHEQQHLFLTRDHTVNVLCSMLPQPTASPLRPCRRVCTPWRLWERSSMRTTSPAT
jgi:asparagine synthase (glutamine-hydrolysing)